MITSLALALALAAPPSVDDARFATAVIASAVAESPRVDVITKEDLRQAMNLEAERQQVGCTETSCLAEVAAAMGARLVIYGSLGTFDDVIALELSAFDGETASSLGRTVVQEKTLKAVADAAAAKARNLRDEALSKTGGEGRLRVLVMDLELRNQATSTPVPTPPAPGMSGLGWAAVGSAGAAAIALVVGVAADNLAVQYVTDADATDAQGNLVKSAADAKDDYDQAGLARVVAVAGYIGAGVFAAAAVGFIAADVLVE
jgi:hypothetical protein